MPEFRKWIIALAVIALFAGLASAQVGTPGTTPAGTAFTCGTTNGSVTPTLRAEGFTELTGDIVIVCSGGGAPLALGSIIPTANFTIFLNTAVTSRLLQTTTAGNASEALLLIDEPGSSLQGYGPAVPQVLCSSAAVGAGNLPGGCTQWVGNSTVTPPAGTPGATNIGVPISSNPNNITTGTGCSTTTPCFNPAASAPGANLFQGVVSGNSVTFFGIPVLPPTTTGLTRVFRITNIRANANQLVSGGPNPGTVQASISINSSTSLVITNSQLTTGFVNPSLTGTLRNSSNTGNLSANGGTFPQCTSVTGSSSSSVALGILQYTENFATAFKTRYTNGAIQNIPGTIYNSESGFFYNGVNAPTGINGPGGTNARIGQADYGTRLKATFNNVPSGVSLFVSTRDVTNSFATPTGNANALLVVSEGAIDTPDQPGPNVVPAATQTGLFSTSSSVTGVGFAPVVTNNGSGSAVWEVVTSTPSTIQTLLFSVYINFTASPATNSPAAPSTITVTMSYAPTPSGGLFTASGGSVASSTLTIPRFSDSLSSAKSLANFQLCTTALLYPYVINTNGFDTGLAIANTTTDPFGTAAQVGTCALWLYGASQPTNPITFGAAGATGSSAPPIATGTVSATLASSLAPGFSGYMIAVCNFQYAHGFAFVSDVGARNLAMGYLALIINNGTINARGPSGEALNN